MSRIPRGLRLAAAALIVSAAFVGCSDSNAPDDEAQVGFQNETDLDIVEVNFSPCTDNLWGPNRLPNNDRINAGDDLVFTLPGEGCWDLRAILEDDSEVTDFDVMAEFGERHEFIVREEDILTAQAAVARGRVKEAK